LRIGSFCILLFPLAVTAQHAATVPVAIRVTDQIGAVIAHAQVRLSPSPENVSSKPETDVNGRLLLQLKPGGYSLSVSATGFKTWAENIVVSATVDPANSTQAIPIVLQVPDVGGVIVYAADSLVLSAEPDHTIATLSLAEFRALPHVTVTVQNSHTDISETYSGVLLATLLEKINAPMGKQLHGEAMTSYLIASGSDGYSIALSLAEVDPNFHPGQVLVADTRNGQPLGKNGPFQLIVSDDKRPARWVRNLVSVTMQRAR
jgi:hypothetical protein